MIQYCKGNILQAHAQALVNTVNTIGVMGKGIALQFRETFPENYKDYKEAAANDELRIGKMFIHKTNRFDGVEYIINFPTKKEWFKPSSYSYVEEGLIDLVNVIKELNITSIAIPPLGCGNGRLNWGKVKVMIEEHLAALEAVQVFLYEPDENVKEILRNESSKKEVKLTDARAALLYVLFHYEAMGEMTSLFSANKLSYFLQRFGIKQLKLKFAPHHYGPYSNQVDHLMRTLNGNYLSGLEQMEAKAFEPLKLNYNKYNEVNSYFETELSNSEKSSIQMVITLVMNYQSSLSLEALASVDSILNESPNNSIDEVYQKITTWSERKKKEFDRSHVEKAYNHLMKFKQELFPALI